jgi:acyl carrier protein
LEPIGPDHAEVSLSIRQLIVDILELPIRAEQIAEDQPIWNDGRLDSVAALELLVAIERRMGVGLPEDDRLVQALQTVETMTSFVVERLREAAWQER